MGGGPVLTVTLNEFLPGTVTQGGITLCGAFAHKGTFSPRAHHRRLTAGGRQEKALCVSSSRFTHKQTEDEQEHDDDYPDEPADNAAE